MTKKVDCRIDPVLLAVGGQDIKDTAPDVDPEFMEYCNAVKKCAKKWCGSGADRDCGNCPVQKECEKYFDKVSSLSSQGKLKGGLNEYGVAFWMAQFEQLKATNGL